MAIRRKVRVRDLTGGYCKVDELRKEGAGPWWTARTSDAMPRAEAEALATEWKEALGIRHGPAAATQPISALIPTTLYDRMMVLIENGTYPSVAALVRLAINDLLAKPSRFDGQDHVDVVDE